MADSRTKSGSKQAPPTAKTMTEAQRAYEQKRAVKAGTSLDGWLEQKRKRAEEQARTAAPPAPDKKPGLLRRLIDRAHKPLRP